MRTSQNGINLIKQFEVCRLSAYKCAAGVPTIGYGHTAGVKMGQTITQAQAESFLKDDLIKYEKRVQQYDNIYHWNQNEFDALVSFAYNIGSINQLTANGTRSRTQIAQKMLAYNKAGGKVLSGLKRRREAERALFLKTVVKVAPTTVQAASIEQTHIQLNYEPNEFYKVVASSLKVRTKPRLQQGEVVKGHWLTTLPNEKIIKNLATMRLNDEIWMYLGLDKKGREQWVCADTGKTAYVRKMSTKVLQTPINSGLII